MQDKAKGSHAGYRPVDQFNYVNININCDLIRSYIYHDLTVAEFCERNQIQRRQFERKFMEGVGAPPKDYKRIMQFEDASRSLL